VHHPKLTLLHRKKEIKAERKVPEGNPFRTGKGFKSALIEEKAWGTPGRSD